MSKTNKLNSKSRDQSLDFTKGIIAILMVIPHVGSALRGAKAMSPEMLPVYQFVDITTFTSLFFFTGLGLYFSIFRKKTQEVNYFESSLNFTKKALVILLAYYIISFLAEFDYLFRTTRFDTDKLIELVFLYKLANYAEFLIAFVLVYLVASWGSKFFRIVLTKWWLVLITSFTAFFISGFFSNLEFPVALRNIQLILFGIDDVGSFPLFRYLPVFLWGSYWGKTVFELRVKHIRVLWVLLAGAVFLSTWLLRYFLADTALNVINRWPPDLSFITIGVFYITALLTITHKLKKFKFITLIGRNMLSFYFFHILIILILRQLLPAQYWLVQWYDVFIAVLLVLFLSMKLSRVSWVNALEF